MKLLQGKRVVVVMAAALILQGCGEEVTPLPAWQELVRTQGQAYPVPTAWISTPEGRIAHDLVLPAAVPKPVPFDFDKEDGPWFWPRDKKEVGLAYFRHLCRTEAGEWIFKKPENVQGLYFARPQNRPGDAYLGHVYAPEAPWVEKEFQLMGESVDWRGGQFVRPPFVNYRFVEEPIRNIKWQWSVREPYIRLSGYTASYRRDHVGIVREVEELTPMTMLGIREPSARYAYTWRGTARPRDREFKIAGGELIIYDRLSREVIAVSRTFQITRTHPRMPYSATWLVSPTCWNGIVTRGRLFIPEFAQRVLMEQKTEVN